MTKSASCFDLCDLLRAAHGDLIGPDAPRLPTPPLLGFDEILEVSAHGGPYGRGGVRARKQTDALQWGFDCHFENDPVMPGSFLLDSLLQLVGFYGAVIGYSGRGRAIKIGAIRFLSEIRPDARCIDYRIDVKKIRYKSQIVVADGWVNVGNKACMIATDLCVAIIRSSGKEVRKDEHFRRSQNVVAEIVLVP